MRAFEAQKPRETRNAREYTNTYISISKNLTNLTNEAQPLCLTRLRLVSGRFNS
jgi:hypothetical protein